MGFGKEFMTVEMLLRDMLYVSYLVPAARIIPLLPKGLTPAVVSDDLVFVSLVIFRGVTSGAARVPMPRIPFDQVNIRTYVIDPVTGAPSVVFVRCGISGALITFLYKILSGMPVEHTPFSITPAVDTKGGYNHYHVAGSWHGSFQIDAEEQERELSRLPPFAGRQEAIDYLIDPLVGFYVAGRKLLRLEVYHAPLVPRVCTAKTIVFPYLTKLGIVGDDEIGHPHNLLLVPFTPFRIYLPPRKTVGYQGS